VIGDHQLVRHREKLRMIEWLQYAVAWTFVKMLATLPRPVARWLAEGGTRLLLWLRPRMRQTGELNLRLAFPEWTEVQAALCWTR
jgi:lauroyl/myristoyl acyltransferase